MARPISLPDWPWPAVMAHRCGGALAPENSLAGLRICRSIGCGGVEFDVMLSAEGTAILMHDETLPRTTNGEGRVLDHGDAYLWTLDAGIRHHVSFANEPIPRFVQAIERCRALDLAANVEIKPCGGHERVTGEVVARLARQGWEYAAVPPLLSSFSIEALKAAALEAPELPRGWLTDKLPEDWQSSAHELRVIAIHTNSRHLTEARAGEIKAAGYRLAVYTENDPQQARLLRNWGVDTLITDRPDLIRA
jgi:glycerophosphoryl diester phosphodiesterase